MHSETAETFEVFPWNKNLETGIEIIDEQHRQLVILLNRLAAHLADKSCEVTLQGVFQELAAYVDYHFQTEEQIWAAHFVGDPWFAAHQHMHHGFVHQVSSWQRAGDNNKSLDEIISDLLGFLTHWLAYHILDSDRRMAKVVQALQNGLPMDAAKQYAEHEMSGAMKVLIDTVLGMYDSLSSRTLELLRERTERRRAEEALRASEERWRFVLDGAGDGVWDWNMASGEVYRSTEGPTILALLSGDTVGCSKIHPDDLGRLRLALQQHLDGDSDCFVNEHRVIHGNGTWSWVLTRGRVMVRDAEGKPLRMIGTHSDITERELAVMFFQNTSEGMVVLDRDQRVITVNPAFRAISGFEPAAVVGHDFFMLCSLGDGGLPANDRICFDEAGFWSGELELSGADGQRTPIFLELSTVSNPDGSPNYHIGLLRDLSSQKSHEAMIWRQTNFDALTGLPNRFMIADRLTQHLLALPAHAGRLLALLILDLDRLRDVNTVYGRARGDEVIQQLARRLQASLGASATLGRLGGDEFVIVLPEVTDLEQLERHALDILAQFETPFQMGDESFFLGASLGVTIAPTDASDAESLFRHAEQAMYRAKELGSNRHAYYAAFMQQGAQIRTRLANELRQALQAGQLVVHYQPIIDLCSGAIVKAEALLRWQHPEFGAVSPATFIPIAEECGVIVDIGDWVFREAVSQAASWREQVPGFQISINMSPRQFQSDDAPLPEDPHGWFAFVDSLPRLGDMVVVEITEGIMMADQPKIMAAMQAMRQHGFSISLDDFGTGFSSLSYLQRYPIDFIKIDRSFVQHLDEGSSQLALCEAMIVMAHKLGIRVVAEGIETEQQSALLRAAGCDFGQGFLYSRAVDRDAFSDLLQRPAVAAQRH
ncbi:MAG: bacteriohemerythrin [Dechloromonas sp.]|nr:bacteriohemerythrin [Dechloromonas sp.]